MALIRKYNATVAEIVNPLEGIYVVSFRNEEKPFKYLPGQFLHLSLDEYDPSSQWPESRCFSMQSSQDDLLLTITYAVKGVFTKRMENELAVGRKVWLKLPYGELFTRDHNRFGSVFIAGGTGVTPFLSLFTSASFADYDTPHLYLGVRSGSYNIYDNDIERAKIHNSTFLYTVKDQEKEGMLNISEIYENNRNCESFFISGPPVMIKNFKKFLLENGVAENHVLTDDWE